MSEKFDVAAHRHFAAAEHLEHGGHTDDAAYHYGICGENAVKSAMRDAGLESHWSNISKAVLWNSPMKGHWGKLSDKLSTASMDINTYAAGRRADALRALASRTTPVFDGWDIDIRYADSRFVPVNEASLESWKNDAATFITSFVNT